MKQITIYNELKKSLLIDADISGIMLMGSVACGSATPVSDLDILLLSSRNEFKTEHINGILVEYLFMTYETAMNKLANSDMEVYHYLNSRIDLDRNGLLSELLKYAKNKYLTYKTDERTKEQLHHWLLTAKIKLSSALISENEVLINFITATNSWKALEAVWAVNDKPMPPSSSVFRFMKDIHIIPCDDWFAQLFCANSHMRANTLINIIDWVLPLLRP